MEQGEGVDGSVEGHCDACAGDLRPLKTAGLDTLQRTFQQDRAAHISPCTAYALYRYIDYLEDTIHDYLGG